MSNNLVKISTGLVIIVGVLMSLYIVLQMPLWLDERYSLFFAVSLPAKDLLLHSKDTHPGLYYALLKGALHYTTNIAALRILLGVLPQWFGVAILLKYLTQQGRPAKTIFFIASLLLLNPFIVFTASQMRMYGLVIFTSCLTYVFLDKFLKKSSRSNMLQLFGILLLGNASDYSFYFISFGVLALIGWKNRVSVRKALLLSLIPLLIFITEFLLLAGVTVKRQFEAASWIPLPNFINVPSLFLTVSGLKSDFFLGQTSPSFSTFLFYLCVVIFCFKATHYVQRNRRVKIDEKVVFLVVLPILAVMSVSVLFPILSQRFFFYQFLPKLSIFLPRAFLPEVVMASILLAKHIGKDSTRSTFNIIRNGAVCCVCLAWVMSMVNIHHLINNFWVAESQKTALISHASELETKNRKRTEIIPSWLWLNKLNERTLSSYGEITGRVSSSENTENLLFQRKVESCQVFENKNIFLMSSEGFYTLQSYYQTVEENLDACCQRVPVDSQFLVWSCN